MDYTLGDLANVPLYNIAIVILIVIVLIAMIKYVSTSHKNIKKERKRVYNSPIIKATTQERQKLMEELALYTGRKQQRRVAIELDSNGTEISLAMRGLLCTESAVSRLLSKIEEVKHSTKGGINTVPTEKLVEPIPKVKYARKKPYLDNVQIERLQELTKKYILRLGTQSLLAKQLGCTQGHVSEMSRGVLRVREVGLPLLTKLEVMDSFKQKFVVKTPKPTTYAKALPSDIEKLAKIIERLRDNGLNQKDICLRTDLTQCYISQASRKNIFNKARVNDMLSKLGALENQMIRNNPFYKTDNI